MTSKTCTKCGEVKPLDGFHKDKKSRDGMVARCKTCVSAQRAEYYGRNRDTILAQKFKYNADYYAQHRERVLAQQAENPHIRWESEFRKRAKRYGYSYLIPSIQHFTREDLIWLHGDKCYHCGGEWDQLDHWPIPVSQGGMHALFNAVPSCADCNLRSWRTATHNTSIKENN